MPRVVQVHYKGDTMIENDIQEVPDSTDFLVAERGGKVTRKRFPTTVRYVSGMGWHIVIRDRLFALSQNFDGNGSFLLRLREDEE